MPGDVEALIARKWPSSILSGDFSLHHIYFGRKNGGRRGRGFYDKGDLGRRPKKRKREGRVGCI
jgi:hypothetical protein